MSGSGQGPEFEARTAHWLSWRDALDRVLGSTPALASEVLPLAEAYGRALAAPVVATATLPPWDNSAMDGYAVLGSDILGADGDHPVRLPVVAEVHAGDPPYESMERGQAVRIMTGAPVPPGADSVVRVEHTDAEDEPGTVEIRQDDDAGRNIRPGGQDVQAGETVLTPGESLTPGVVGVLAALGRSTVEVGRIPEVAIVPTGDELKGPQDYDQVEAGLGIPESNGPMLVSAVRACGAIPRLMDTVPDRRDALREALTSAAESDVVVTLGGASMGEADLVKRALDDLGFRQDFWRVRMRPGSPFGLGFLTHGERQLPVFGLPGNPVSAFVTFELFVRPALLRMAGHGDVLRRTIQARAAETWTTRGQKTYFLRVSLDDSTPPMASLTGPQSSGLVRGLARVDGLAVIPEDWNEVAPGTEVEVILLPDAPAARPWSLSSRG